MESVSIDTVWNERGGNVNDPMRGGGRINDDCAVFT